MGIVPVLLIAAAAFGVARLLFPPRRAQNEAPPAAETSPNDAAPAVLHIPGIAEFDFKAALMDGHGYPIADWNAVTAWVEGTGARQAHARNLARRAWLLHVRDALGGALRVVESRGAMVLSSYELHVAQAAARYVDDVRGRIVRALDGIARFPRDEQSVMLVLDSQEDYYRYIANYYPEDGEFAFSGGMFVNAGCPHFIGVKDELSLLEPVIAHEMTHNAVTHLPLPMWLNEGIAVSTEKLLTYRQANHQDSIDKINKHRDYWTPERVQEFWSGESFVRTDEGNELSYDMAQHIVQLLGRDWSSFARFTRAAHRDDGGAAAAREVLRLDLGHLAAAAIGMPEQANWSPRPDAWKKIEEKA